MGKDPSRALEAPIFAGRGCPRYRLGELECWFGGRLGAAERCQPQPHSPNSEAGGSGTAAELSGAPPDPRAWGSAGRAAGGSYLPW